jgi:hypothetical protein
MVDLGKDGDKKCILSQFHRIAVFSYVLKSLKMWQDLNWDAVPPARDPTSNYCFSIDT